MSGIKSTHEKTIAELVDSLDDMAEMAQGPSADAIREHVAALRTKMGMLRREFWERGCGDDMD